MFQRHTHQTQKHRSNSQRRKVKSPIRIKDKIRQLEQKIQKEAQTKQVNRKQRMHFHHPSKQYNEDNERMRPQTQQKYSLKEQITRTISNSKNSPFASAKQLTTPRKTSMKEQQQSKKPLKMFRRASEKHETPKIQKQPQDSLKQLKGQNQKFREVYVKSQQRMTQLEVILRQMKERHENEKGSLQKAIDQLQKRIVQKKISLGHLYSYDEKGNHFLLVQDRIIAQTDNQNSSSSPAPASKKPSVTPSIHLKPSPQNSDLSLESKK